MYGKDPLAGVSAEDAPRVIGGEACAWGELISPDAALPRIFPRASAYGGRLWNYEAVENHRDAGEEIREC